MRKPTHSRVLLITGSHVSAVDFDLLLENLGRSRAPAGDGDAWGRRGQCDEPDLECAARWATDDDLAPAREFINHQHRAGEPWFCYVNPRIQMAPVAAAEMHAPLRGREDEDDGRHGSLPSMKQRALPRSVAGASHLDLAREAQTG